MGKVSITAGRIVLDRIEDDAPLCARLRALKPGQSIELRIDSIAGRWERDVIDGTDVMRLAAGTPSAWGDGQAVEIRLVPANELATFGLRQLWWDTPDARIR
jgi:hypothetical protein